MAGEILEYSRPVQGVKISSRIERERYRTVLVAQIVDITFQEGCRKISLSLLRNQISFTAVNYYGREAELIA